GEQRLELLAGAGQLDGRRLGIGRGVHAGLAQKLEGACVCGLEMEDLRPHGDGGVDASGAMEIQALLNEVLDSLAVLALVFVAIHWPSRVKARVAPALHPDINLDPSRSQSSRTVRCSIFFWKSHPLNTGFARTTRWKHS